MEMAERGKSFRTWLTNGAKQLQPKVLHSRSNPKLAPDLACLGLRSVLPKGKSESGAGGENQPIFSKNNLSTHVFIDSFSWTSFSSHPFCSTQQCHDHTDSVRIENLTPFFHQHQLLANNHPQQTPLSCTPPSSSHPSHMPAHRSPTASATYKRNSAPPSLNMARCMLSPGIPFPIHLSKSNLHRQF